MNKFKLIYSIFAFMAFFQFGFSQVDVIYNDLVWSDEFDTNGVINPSNWHHQTQIPSGGNWYNGEVQHYTNQLTNSSVNNGLLSITAKKEPYTDQGYTKQYTSARLNSKYAFLYGRVDIRAKIPTNQGTWPALWMLGKNIIEPGAFFSSTHGTTAWPACGEIDIMEHGITPSQPINYIQSALHTPSSFGNTTNIGGALANNLGTNFHVYSMNWSPNQITFLLDGVAFYTYNPTIKTPNNWPFTAQQYLLLNIAMGGVAGTIPSNFNQATMEIDYVRVYQNIVPDTQSPTNFTASVGAISGTTVELLMNAQDNSGNVNYTISYGTQSFTVFSPSGIQKSEIITNLTPNTSYTFSITATDASGNAFINNPIVLNATTANILQCSGFDTEASEGFFTLGYNYTFQTIGNNVKIDFELLDSKIGLVAFLRKQIPFSEVQMTNVSGQTFTHTITGQTAGSTISYAVKFAFSGGLAVTKYITYVVGTSCNLEMSDSPKLIDFYFQNPANDFVSITSNDIIDKVDIHNLIGNKVLTTTANTVDVSILSKGIYLITVYSGSNRGTKKIIIN